MECSQNDAGSIPGLRVCQSKLDVSYRHVLCSGDPNPCFCNALQRSLYHVLYQMPTSLSCPDPFFPGLVNSEADLSLNTSGSEMAQMVQITLPGISGNSLFRVHSLECMASSGVARWVEDDYFGLLRWFAALTW